MSRASKLSAEKHEAKRAGISADVEKFLASGGEIEKVSHGATSDTKLTIFERPVSDMNFDDIHAIIARRKKPW